MPETERTVRLELPDGAETGHVVDLRGTEPDPTTVAAAVRGDPVDGVTVACSTPRAVHGHVGLVTPDASVAPRTALSAAARSRGLTAPQDEDLAAARDRLADLELPDSEGPDPAAARRRLAGTESDVERLRERVATLRGRLQAARDAGRETVDIEAELADATRALSEAETERAAARETLDRAERLAREVRDVRERRRRLEDRVANLERAARAHLVDRCRDEYAAAVAALGVDPDDPFDVGDVTAALAVGRVAAFRAPVVVAVDRFRTLSAAADWFDAPVIRCDRPGV